MSKIKPCANGPRHTWTFVKNVTKATGNLSNSRIHISRVGIYRCTCGERKYGPTQWVENEVNPLNALINQPQPGDPK